jgi:DNA (cytosine-5)-methyltransferase 1
MNAIELFSGAGGLAIGVERAGFKTQLLVERDRNAAETLRQNFPEIEVFNGDVRKYNFGTHENIDLVAGGPPCQPFSMGGKAKGSEDSRDMFPEAIRAVSETRPKAFIFENVRGLLRPAFENYVEFIRLQMEYPDFPISKNADWEANLRRLQRHKSTGSNNGLFYRVFLHEADAADFGVPQRRHRVFFIGFRSDISARWFFPSKTHSLDNLLWEKYITFEYWDRHKIPKRLRDTAPSRYVNRIARLKSDGSPDLLTGPWQTVRDAFNELTHPKRSSKYPDHKFQPGARSYPGHTGCGMDEPAKALKAGDHGVPGGENMLRQRNGRVRYFTIRESARLQTFPDSHQFFGSWTETMRQLGNAVPVKLAEVVAESIQTALYNAMRDESAQNPDAPVNKSATS